MILRTILIYNFIKRALIILALALLASPPARAEGVATEATPANSRSAAQAAMTAWANDHSSDPPPRIRTAGYRGNILVGISTEGGGREAFFSCHHHDRDMACHPLPPWVSPPENTSFTLLDLSRDDTGAGSSAHLEEDEGWAWSTIALATAGSVYGAGLLHAIWERYFRAEPENGTAQDPPAPSPEDMARARQELDRALEELFTEAERIGAELTPEFEGAPSERDFHFRARDFDLRINRAQLTSLLIRVARANTAAATAVAACGSSLCGHNHGTFSAPPASTEPNRRSRFQATSIPAVADSNPNYLLEAAAFEEPSPKMRARLLQWLKVAALTPVELLWSLAPRTTLDFLENPREQSLRSAGFAANLLADRGIIGGSIMLAALPPWLFAFEAFLDPFHVWCSLGMPIYLGGANAIYFLGNATWDGLQFRGGSLSLSERAEIVRESIKIRRAVSRARNRVVIPSLARGLERGLSRNHFLKAQHGRIASLPTWIHSLATGPLWADFADGSRSNSLLETGNALFGEDMDFIFGPNNASETERAFRWRESIAGQMQTMEWISLRLAGLIESQKISRRDFLTTEWWLGKVNSLIRQTEMMGLLRIAEGESGEAREPEIFRRIFRLLGAIHRSLGETPLSAEIKLTLHQEIRSLQ